MKNAFRLLAAVAITLLFTACGGKKVMVPPAFDLETYGVVGMIEFSSSAEGDLGKVASQRFVESIQSAQPGVRILELGAEADVLEQIDHARLDYRAIQAIASEYNVDALVVGSLDVTDVKPRVDFMSISKMGVSAEVEAELTTRLYDAVSGATLWTRASRARDTVGHVGMTAGGTPVFGANDPDESYGALVNTLVYSVTRDFRVSYVKR